MGIFRDNFVNKNLGLTYICSNKQEPYGKDILSSRYPTYRIVPYIQYCLEHIIVSEG